MNSKTIKRAAASLAALLTVTLSSACYDTTMLAEGGIGGTGISSGPISGFGSIYVNGVEFDTTEAEIYINGDRTSEEALQLGMMVDVYGKIDAADPSLGRATRIDFSYTLQGELTAIDRSSATLYTANQTILSDELTLFADGSLAALKTGDFVAVSGLVDANGRVMARYIVKTAADPRLAVDTIVAPSSAALAIGETAAGSATDLPAGRLPLDQGDSVQLTAYIEEIVEENVIRAAGQLIRLDEKTAFIDGNRSELATNREIRIEATLTAERTLLARQIAFLGSSDIQLRATVDSLDLARHRMTLGGSEVSVDNTTLMIDRSAQALRRFSLADIRVGDLLNVYGHSTDRGTLLRRLERLDPQP